MPLQILSAGPRASRKDTPMEYVVYGTFAFVGAIIVLRLSVEYIPPVRNFWKSKFGRKR